MHGSQVNLRKRTIVTVTIVITSTTLEISANIEATTDQCGEVHEVFTILMIILNVQLFRMIKLVKRERHTELLTEFNDDCRKWNKVFASRFCVFAFLLLLQTVLLNRYQSQNCADIGKKVYVL